jgi:serine/threonine-protein kinase
MQVGEQVGPFDIEKEIGGGAMGSVYQARYRKTGQRVAIKVIAPGLLANETARARFERETNVLKQLNHPNIVRFYAAGRAQGTPYYAMEYIEGEGLGDVLQRRGRFTWEEVVELGKQVCGALQHAHQQGIIHRDLKPSNLMITSDGKVKLADFGIAKDLDVTALTSANCTVGTAAYMSPEQCKGERNLTNKSDLYSLGVVLYELLVGHKPFQAETTMDMFLLHVQGKFERPSRVVLDIPVWLDTLVCQLLEKKPEHRPFDAAMVARALEEVADKVTALQSAGVDAAKARYVDRAFQKSRPDRTDKEAARTLLSNLRRQRRKRETKSLFEKGWFQGAAIFLVLLGIAWILYQVFKPPDADLLYQRAQKLMESNKWDKWTEANADDGAIKKYLNHYQTRQDEHTQKVRQWSDLYTVLLREQTLDNRRKAGMSPDGDAEKLARRARDSEDRGDLEQARERWLELTKYKDDSDPEQRVYGLLAQKRAADVDSARAREKDLIERIESSRPGHTFELKSEKERAVFAAIRLKRFEDPDARVVWDELKRRFQQELKLKDDEEMRQHLEKVPWYLLAAKQAHEAEKLPRANEEPDEKAKRIRSKLDNLPQDPVEAWKICREIVDLYGKTEGDKDLEELVKRARASLQQILPSPEDKP